MSIKSAQTLRLVFGLIAILILHPFPVVLRHSTRSYGPV